jgi:dipeptidyl-peptidase-4
VAEPVWIKKQQQFLWTSDRSGWRQVYLFNRNGTLVRQVTTDGFDVLELLGVDEARGDVYIRAASPSASQSQIVRVSLTDKRSARITPRAGFYSITASPAWKYAAITYSSINTPPSAAIYDLASMKQVRPLGDNSALQTKLTSLGLPPVTFFQIPAADGATKLDAYRIVPPGFDSTKKYPVLMYAYGGPAAPQVIDQWGGSRFLFHEMLSQHGYVIVVTDNRGSAWRGAKFRKMTQYKLGIAESDDQIAVARWIGQQSWGDAARIGMWGWSYGGYLTAMSAFRGGNLFRAAISVAPVTDWRYYDSIYTERFMWLPSENAEAYRTSSPLSYVSGLTARYLLVHGTGDDNVHPQNSYALAQKLEMARMPFSLMLFPNKTHSIAGPGGTLTIFDLLQRFVLENL